MNVKRAQERILQSSRPNSDGCWIWQKSTSRNGYGRYAVGGGVAIGAHRASFAAFIGDIPENMDVCHKCDVRNCVNPAHLFIGTRSENIQDALRKGRLRKHPSRIGSEHPSAKLNEAKAREILIKLAEGRSKKSLSLEYGVSQRVILLISRRELWKHVSTQEAA